MKKIHIKEKRCDLNIPNIAIGRYIGGGANGDVFEAVDNLLGRKIAVKIWNKRGERRAQAEISKIAKIQHDLFVSTYQFGFIEEKPYAIMEFVDGKNGKEWLKEEPQFNEKLDVWNSYSKALKLLYKKNEFHGDPHLGNVLIAEYNEETSDNKRIVKLADTGTSIFWESHEKFENRDVDLILETAKQMFESDKIIELIEIPNNLSPVSTLEIIDCYCDLLSFIVNTEDDPYASGRNAGYISEMIINVPVFNLDCVVDLCVKRGLTGSRRLGIRLNRKLNELDSSFNQTESITSETKDEYDKLRKSFFEKYRIRD